jgi:hypothetical protein
MLEQVLKSLPESTPSVGSEFEKIPSTSAWGVKQTNLLNMFYCDSMFSFQFYAFKSFFSFEYLFL